MPDSGSQRRVERDPLGEVSVPAEALYGVQTKRALDNFQISRLRIHPGLIIAFAEIKKAAAEANRQTGKLAAEQAEAIIRAAEEVIAGVWHGQFKLDVFQAGAGTSYNMNVNEVIANRAPYFVTGPLASNNNYWVGPGEAIELFALGRDDDADGITYTWSATSGQITGSGPTVQYRAPNTVGVIDVVKVQITDGVNAPVSAQFAISVPANVARVAAVRGSSQSFTPGDRDQSAENVVDGDISGETAPNEDRSAEWRSDNEKAGAFIELTWTKPVTIDRIRLYDRPNPLDQVIAGIITFSDGTSINVGQLPNDMTMSELQFPAKTITSLRFTVTEVSGSTGNIGLAEIEALRPEAP